MSRVIDFVVYLFAMLAAATLGNAIVAPIVADTSGESVYWLLHKMVQGLTAPETLDEWLVDSTINSITSSPLVVLLIVAALITLRVLVLLFSPIVPRLIAREMAKQRSIHIQDAYRTVRRSSHLVWHARGEVIKTSLMVMAAIGLALAVAGAGAGLLAAGLAFVGTTFNSGVIQIGATIVTFIISIFSFGLLKELAGELFKDLSLEDETRRVLNEASKKGR